jgi:hypothetical protein
VVVKGRIFVALLAALAVVSPAAAQRQPHLSAADRAAINKTLDVFVNGAVKRKDIAASYDVVTPELRGGMTRARWARGSIPVYPYPAKGATFHRWTIQYRTTDELAIELLLSPRADKRKTLGQFLFHVYLHPGKGRWLVDSFMPAATFAPEGKAPVVQAASDFQANPSAQTYNRAGSTERQVKPPRIGAKYAVIPFAMIGLILAGAAGWALVGRIRYSRLESRS